MYSVIKVELHRKLHYNSHWIETRNCHCGQGKVECTGWHYKPEWWCRAWRDQWKCTTKKSSNPTRKTSHAYQKTPKNKKKLDTRPKQPMKKKIRPMKSNLRNCARIREKRQMTMHFVRVLWSFTTLSRVIFWLTFYIKIIMLCYYTSQCLGQCSKWESEWKLRYRWKEFHSHSLLLDILLQLAIVCTMGESIFLPSFAFQLFLRFCCCYKALAS